MAQYRRVLVAAQRSSVPVLLEQVAIAIAGAVGEAASRRERPELRIKPLAAEDEDGLLLDEMHRALEAARLVGLERCDSSPRGAACRPPRAWRAPVRKPTDAAARHTRRAPPIRPPIIRMLALCHVTPAFRHRPRNAPRLANGCRSASVSRWPVSRVKQAVSSARPCASLPSAGILTDWRFAAHASSGRDSPRCGVPVYRVSSSRGCRLNAVSLSRSLSSPRLRRPRRSSRRPHSLPNRSGFAEVRGDGRQRHRRSAPVRDGATDDEGPRRVPVRPRHHARRQHVRRPDGRPTTSRNSSSRTRRCSARA